MDHNFRVIELGGGKNPEIFKGLSCPRMIIHRGKITV